MLWRTFRHMLISRSDACLFVLYEHYSLSLTTDVSCQSELKREMGGGGIKRSVLGVTELIDTCQDFFMLQHQQT